MNEVAHETIVDPEPSVVAKRVAVGLLNGCPRRGADVREEEGRLDVAGDLAQVAIVPGGLDAPEDGASVFVPYQPTPKPSPLVVSTPRRAWRLWSMSEWSGL